MEKQNDILLRRHQTGCQEIECGMTKINICQLKL